VLTRVPFLTPQRSYIAASAASSLQYRLLDWYGGLLDLRLGLLRSPYPRDIPLADVWAEALPTEAERRLAARCTRLFSLYAHHYVYICFTCRWIDRETSQSPTCGQKRCLRKLRGDWRLGADLP